MKKRVISAIVMILLFVPFVILGKVPFSIFVAVLGMFSLKEMLDLEKGIPFGLKIASFCVCLFLILHNYFDLDITMVTDYQLLGIIFLLSTSLMVIIGNIQKYNYKDSLWLISVTMMIGIMFNNLIDLRKIGLFVFVYIFLIATVTDTFALLCGKYFGKNKLAPNISPKKTVEGALGGSVFGTIIGVIFYLLCVRHDVNIMLLVVITFILTIVGQIGDLFFSSIKRHYDIKDFSKLIPGHGGILDRLDSVLFIAYAYLILILIL